MTTTSLVIYGAGAAIGYIFIANRMLAVGAHFRARAIDLGTQLLKDASVPDAVKLGIERWLCDIPRVSYAWTLNLLLLPAVFLVLLGRWRGNNMAKRPEMPSPAASYWKTWDDFTTMAIIATLCNSPLAFVFGVIQLLFAVSFVRGNYMVWVAVSRLMHKHDGSGWLHRHA